MWLSESQTGAWLELVNVDPEFQLVSRWTDVQFEIQCDQTRRQFCVSPQKLARSDAMRADIDTFSLAGSRAAWSAFMQTVPASPNHHILGMDRRRTDFEIQAGRHVFIKHLRVMTIVFGLLRQAGNEVKHG